MRRPAITPSARSTWKTWRWLRPSSAPAEELRAPVILQTTPSTVRYAGTGLYCAMVAELAREASVPVAMHLDHGDSFELCVRALRDGYTSVMIDGSKLPLKENIALTKRVADMCNAAGGAGGGRDRRVGGKEDDLEVGERRVHHPGGSRRV